MSPGPGAGDADFEAAEYVIGTLDRDERAAFAERLPRDTASRQAVAAWEARFRGLDGAIDPIVPPPGLWPRIERALVEPIRRPQFKVIEGSGRPWEDASRLRRSRDRWRVGALLGGAVAASLMVYLADRTFRAEAPDATYVAAVNRGGDKPALIIRVDLKSGQVLVRPVAADQPSGHSLELWYIGDDKKPRSMGLVPAAPVHVALPPGAAGDQATFAISVEPPGGSKTGSPTGPVVYAGQLVKE